MAHSSSQSVAPRVKSTPARSNQVPRDSIADRTRAVASRTALQLSAPAAVDGHPTPSRAPSRRTAAAAPTPLALETDAKRIALLPHQAEIYRHASSSDMRFPFYLMWQMGSGKTFGALACTFALRGVHRPRNARPRVLVLCPLSLSGQWLAQIALFTQRAVEPPVADFTVAHYEQLEQGLVCPAKFDMTIVDEAARFRNAFRENIEDDTGRVPRMLKYEIYQIMRCERVVYLSGTPILAEPEIERLAFDTMMKTTPRFPAMGRVSAYDPRDDPQFLKRFARRQDHRVPVAMLWSQTLLYLLYQRRGFELRPKGYPKLTSRVTETGNSFDTQLLKLINNPFSGERFAGDDDPERSPKIMRVVTMVETLLARNRKQTVYSTRKLEGVEHIRYILVAREVNARVMGSNITWQRVKALRKRPRMNSADRLALDLLDEKYLLLTGDIDGPKRFDLVKKYNNRLGRYRTGKVFLFTGAGGSGVDLHEVSDVHLLEVNPIFAEEQQAVARAIRLYGHRAGDGALVDVYHYVGVFPNMHTPVDELWEDVVSSILRNVPPWTTHLSNAVRAALFDAHIRVHGTQRKGGAEPYTQIVGGVEIHCTVDEKNERRGRERNERVDRAVRELTMFDPVGPSLLETKRLETEWSARARELVREHKHKVAAHEDEVTGKHSRPSHHGWDRASSSVEALKYMLEMGVGGDWWGQYEEEQYPGMYDVAWRAATKHRKPLPLHNSSEAGLVRLEVRKQLRRLRVDANSKNLLADRKFLRCFAVDQLNPTHTFDAGAVKRVLLRQRYIRHTANNIHGWTWADPTQTFKIIPRTGQTGHAALIAELRREHTAVVAVVAPTNRRRKT